MHDFSSESLHLMLRTFVNQTCAMLSDPSLLLTHWMTALEDLELCTWCILSAGPLLVLRTLPHNSTS